MNSQRLDLIQAQDKIVQAIDEMDQIMIEKFSTTFEKSIKNLIMFLENYLVGKSTNQIY